MKKILVFASMALAGCATHYTAAQLAAKAKENTTPQLCAITLLNPPPGFAEAAEDEIKARGDTCDWDQARAIAQTFLEQRQERIREQQAQQANFMNALGTAAILMQQSAPHYYSAPPTQTTCVQQGVFTNCNSY